MQYPQAAATSTQPVLPSSSPSLLASQRPLVSSATLPLAMRSSGARPSDQSKRCGSLLATGLMATSLGIAKARRQRAVRGVPVARHTFPTEEAVLAILSQGKLEDDHAAAVQAFVEASSEVTSTSVQAVGSAAHLEGWSLAENGFEFIELPVPGGAHEAQRLVLQAGSEMADIASIWRPIKNGDANRGRRQSYLRMRKHTAPISVAAAEVLEAANQVVRSRLGPRTLLNDCVVIADFDASLPRQELHRDVRREATATTTHGMLVPLAHGVRLHLVPGSHAPRHALGGTFDTREVLCLSVPPGWALLWDALLVHAGDGALAGDGHNFVEGSPNRLRMHAYAEQPEEGRPYDDKGDRDITELKGWR